MQDLSEPVALGPRVLLRRPVDSDRAGWSTLVRGSREFLEGWIQVPDVNDDPGGAAWFDRTVAAVGDERFEKLLVVQQDGGAIVGVLNFNEIVRGSFQSAYLGYWIGAEYSGRGLMTEALALALGHGFAQMKLHRVEANVQPDNEASRALVRRAGFVKEGFSERYLKVGGQWRDHERWALTVERWETATGGCSESTKDMRTGR